MIDRYKKKGGFVQLVQLIETTAKPKQDQFLQIIRNESVEWEEAVRKHVLSSDRILSWPSWALAEIFSRVQLLTLVGVLQSREVAVIERCLAHMSHGERRKFQSLMDEKTTTPAERATCEYKLIAEVRALVQQNILKMDKIDIEMVIRDDIEERLAHKGQSIDLNESEVIESFLQNDESANHNAVPGHDKANKEEVEFLKRKVNALIAENAQLKHDLSVLRTKLEQIRKIA